MKKLLCLMMLMTTSCWSQESSQPSLCQRQLDVCRIGLKTMEMRVAECEGNNE